MHALRYPSAWTRRCLRDWKHLSEMLSPKRQAGGRIGSVPEQFVRLVRQETRKCAEFPFLSLVRLRIELQETMINHPCFGVLFELFGNPSQLPGKPEIVGIQQRNNLALRPCNTKVECGGLPAVRFVQIAYAGAVFLHALGRIVRRPIVNYQNLHPLCREVLGQNTLNSLFDKMPVVIRVDQDRNKGRPHLGPTHARHGFPSEPRAAPDRKPSRFLSGRVTFSRKNHAGSQMS